MLFSSIPFLYYFLPAVLIVYFLVPRVLKNAVLLLSSLVFYGCTDLEAISISGRTGHIREDAFDDCSYLHFIFFDGLHSEWVSLYDEFINPYACVFCADGSFYQGGERYE